MWTRKGGAKTRGGGGGGGLGKSNCDHKRFILWIV